MGAKHCQRYPANVQQTAGVIVSYSAASILEIARSSVRELQVLRGGPLQLQALNILGQVILYLVPYRTLNNISGFYAHLPSHPGVKLSPATSRYSGGLGRIPTFP